MPHLKINSQLEPFMTRSKPIKVAIGGRASGKSVGFGDIFTMKMCSEAADIYCLREYQDSLTDSVHRVFKDSIQSRLQVAGFQVQENTVIAPNGAKTTYKGASRNPDSIQSAQGYKYSCFEEGHRASQASLDKLLPTIIRNRRAECWFSANPQSSADPFSQRFIVPYQKQLDRDGYYEDELHLSLVMNWRQNPWWNAESEKLRCWDFENMSRAKYNWIWKGRFNDEVDNSIIKTEWFDAAIDAHLDPRLKEMFKP
jgi:phage terminase large subunit